MPAKRQRDYKAEYRRRLAKGRTAGKSRQQARGHKAKEHVERARRTQAKYGVSPAQLTRLRRLAFGRAMEAYEAIASNPIDEATVRRGMRLLHGEDLQALIDMDDMDVISAQKIGDSYFGQLAKYFPKSIDDIEAQQTNPLWYHP